MGSPKTNALIAVVLGLVLLGLAAAYWSLPAQSLPSFLPGYEAHSSARHVKHGLGAFALAFFCFMIAWFQTGPKHRT